MHLFDVDYVLNGQGDLDAVSVIMRPEDDSLNRLDPLLGTRSTIRLQVVCPMMGGHGEVGAFLFLVCDVGGDGVTQVNLAIREVNVGGVGVVG